MSYFARRLPDMCLMDLRRAHKDSGKLVEKIENKTAGKGFPAVLFSIFLPARWVPVRQHISKRKNASLFHNPLQVWWRYAQPEFG
jgi:hypothetical protein